MSKYVFIAKYSVDAIKGMISSPQDRKDAIGKLLSAAGMSMIDCFFSPSSARVVLIAEGPATKNIILCFPVTNVKKFAKKSWEGTLLWDKTKKGLTGFFYVFIAFEIGEQGA